MSDINIQKFASGEVRVFKPEADGDWKLSSHKPVPNQKKIRKGTLMENCPPPFVAEGGDV